ncbi:MULTISPECIES: copper amine oxidase N-terminal domain-containing protein [unclassified Paenibacillus]|uniref:copper amine oxidase N-terminal domain-containing protein n=1 Tax=unclassified Paenibacillus TaxID=185978 RepID=UPI003640E0A4
MKPLMKKSLVVLTLSTMMSTGAAYASTDNVQPINALAPITIQAATSPVTINLNGEPLSEYGYQAPNAAESMLPLRAVAEKLGYTLVWNPETLSVDLNKGPIFTTVKTGEDSYSINKMLTTLGTAPELVDSKLYVPSSFVSKILHASVAAQGNSVSITLAEQQKKVQATGVITAIRNEGNHSSVQIQGVGMNGLVLNVGDETEYQMLDETKLSLSDLHIGLTVVAEHSLAATLSLPPQTPTTKITVLDPKRQADLLGTAGQIEEVRSNDAGKTSFLIKGTKLSDQSQSEIVLQISDETTLINKDGDLIDKSLLVKGTQVIGFYGPTMTRSLPPIGNAWKIVVDLKEEQEQDQAVQH